MTKIIIEGNFSEVYDITVKNTKSNTYVPIPKKHQGKKVKILVVDDERTD